jgi:hypothetical protein
MPQYRSAGHLFLYIDAPYMRVSQFRPHSSQAHFARADRMAKRATELLEPSSLSALLIRASICRHICDDTHGREHGNASFEISAHLLPSGSEAEFSVLSHAMAAFATVSLEHVLSKFLLAFMGGDQSVQCGISLLR